MNKQLFIRCTMLICVLQINQNALSQDGAINAWPQFRGMNCSGLAHPDQKPPIDFGPDQNVVWKVQLISGVSSPCIWNDRIFLTGFDEENKKLHVLCYHRTNGKLIWDHIVPAKEIEPFHVTGSPADATPATDGERIYVHFGSYGLLCYDFAGEVLWTHELPVNDNRFGTGTSPITVDNLVILMVRRPKRDEYLLALNCKTGQQAWKKPINGASHSTPIIWKNSIIVHYQGSVSGFSVKDGTEIWQVLVNTTGTSSPVANNNMLYVGTWTNGGNKTSE